MKILVVDDDRTSRAFFKRELESGGYEVLLASDGFEALHVIHGQDIDLVTLDIEMPDMDGYQVCAWLRSEQFKQRFQKNSKNRLGVLPVVFVTSNESPESRAKGFRAGATDFVVKSPKPGELLSCVNRILNPENVLAGLTALVVDDSRLVRSMVTELLIDQEVEVIEAANGLEGFEKVKELGDQLDMVLTDLDMPGMSGDQLCERIRDELGLKELPLVVLTAIPDRTQLINLFDAGANDYLVKPFAKEELVARLKAVVEMRRTLETEVAERKRVEADLAAAADEGKKAAAQAKAASTVIHNVNNVLNSLNVSCSHIERVLNESRLPQLLLALDLVEKNRDRLGEFFTKDPKGLRLPEYFQGSAEVLEEEYRGLLEENMEMRKKINLMREVVSTQQDRLTKGHEDRAKARTPVRDLVEEALKVVEPLLNRYQVEIDEHFEGDPFVVGDEVQFTHVLVNLFKNGIEAMAEVTGDRVFHIEHISGSGKHFLRITDTGEGISDENIKNIFSSGFTTKPEGHGFGLAFCQETMQTFGGDIQVESGIAGQGATFTLTFKAG